MVIETTSRTVSKEGDWVMIPPYKGPAKIDDVNIENGNSKEYQLYNLKEDSGQQNNLAESNKEKLQDMLAKFEAIRGDDYNTTHKIEMK